MNTLKLADNIAFFRHKRHVTQEELADFLGVTKASVSKWETRQSMPDIMILPQLAAYFDITIDALLGYEPQLSPEQIQKLYRKLAADFADKTFEEAMAACKAIVKEYYSCYPLLFQICCLWLNHFSMAESEAGQMEVLNETEKLCNHIIEHTDDLGLCNDVKFLRAMIYLLLGKPNAVIDTLEEMFRYNRMAAQSDSVLTRAYMMTGKRDKAVEHSQINMYMHLLALVSDATQYIDVCSDNLELCEETIRRIEQVGEAFSFDMLHPNSAAQFYYQAAVMYCGHNRIQEAIGMLERYVDACVRLLLVDDVKLHGDCYFTQIGDWFNQPDMGNQAPRDKKLIWDSAIDALKHPTFSVLEGNKAFEHMKDRLRGGRENG